MCIYTTPNNNKFFMYTKIYFSVRDVRKATGFGI